MGTTATAIAPGSPTGVAPSTALWRRCALVGLTAGTQTASTRTRTLCLLPISWLFSLLSTAARAAAATSLLRGRSPRPNRSALVTMNPSLRGGWFVVWLVPGFAGPWLHAGTRSHWHQRGATATRTRQARQARWHYWVNELSSDDTRRRRHAMHYAYDDSGNVIPPAWGRHRLTSIGSPGDSVLDSAQSSSERSAGTRYSSSDPNGSSGW